MGIENMRRWPMYILFALCILLFLSLFNSWSLEEELRIRISDLNTQLKECARLQSSCISEQLTLMEQRNSYMDKVQNLEKSKERLINDISDAMNKLKKAEGHVNTTQVELHMCTTELQSFKNLQVTMTATIQTLRLENAQLIEKKQKVEELEKEIGKLKSALTTKAAPQPPVKITPAAQPMKQSPSLANNNPVEKPAVESKLADQPPIGNNKLADLPPIGNNKLADQPPIESNNAVEMPAVNSNDQIDQGGMDNNNLEDNNANEEIDANNGQEFDPQF